jgi:ferredoxin-nitrite reductase
VPLDTPINVHLTGCHHSCAQHYIGDIGLIGARVALPDSEDTVEGYHIHVGGGYGPDAAIGRELFRDIKATEAPRAVARILKAYIAHRQSPEETFVAFAKRHETDAIKAWADAEAVS